MSANLQAAADAAATRKPIESDAAGRYTTGTMVDIGKFERVGTGVLAGKLDSEVFCIYQSGKTTVTGIPVYAVAAYIASGKGISPAAVVAAFKDAGMLAKLAKAVEDASK